MGMWWGLCVLGDVLNDSWSGLLVARGRSS